MLERRDVTWFPSYGAEMRGGTANCTVIMADEMIGSPVVLNPDILVIMNKASLVKFEPRLRRGGLLVFDSSLIRNSGMRDGTRAVPVPATKIASSIGNTKSANMVMLGALIAETGLLKKSSILGVFEGREAPLGSRGGKINTTSILEGMKYIEDSKG
jgi:2-oxoglutarate ferredoxin oxidoreductase subunit gamma